MFKVCGIIGFSKIKFFNFSSTERVKHNTNINKYINNTNKKSKPFQTSQAYKSITIWAVSTKAEAFFRFLLKL